MPAKNKTHAKNKMHVKTGDMVMVISGKDGPQPGKPPKIGRVLAVYPGKSKVVVEKVNIVKKHQKPTKDLPQGGILDKEAPIHSSNVMLYCTECKSVTRRSMKQTTEGKVRVCKHCGHNLPDKRK
ncbi:MAG: 50S ribosomal protein L24 [Gracilibacteraceae bacterium]|jgi:large subunit ribosomal protein L24|nr:50S ribosomal protein L24 [Gracilibacteraceae bacterium]